MGLYGVAVRLLRALVMGVEALRRPGPGVEVRGMVAAWFGPQGLPDVCLWSFKHVKHINDPSMILKVSPCSMR